MESGLSARHYNQRATAIFNVDVFALPFPKDGNLDLSDNERIIAEDAVKYQRKFIRLGTDAKVTQKVPAEALAQFDHVLATQINAVTIAVHFVLWTSIIGQARSAKTTHLEAARSIGRALTTFVCV